MTKLNVRAKLAIVLLFAALTLSPLVLAASAEPATTSQLIDAEGARGKLFFDQQNNPYVFYSHETIAPSENQPKGIYYAAWDGEKWNLRGLNYAADSLFIIDMNGNPHIVNISNRTVQDTPIPNRNTDIGNVELSVVTGDDRAFDPKGALYQVYYNQSQSNGTYTASLSCAVWTIAGFEQTIIDQKESNDSFSALAPRAIKLDQMGNPHVIYMEITTYNHYSTSRGNNLAVHLNHNIKYAYWTGNRWITQTIAVNSSATGNFFLDSEGQPHLWYIQEENFTYNPYYDDFFGKSTVRYLHLNGEEWVNEKVKASIDSMDYGQRPILKLAADGNPQIYYFYSDYQNYENTALKVTSWNGSKWIVKDVWKVPNAQYTSFVVRDMVFDRNGDLHFIYDDVIGYWHVARYGDLTHFYVELTDHTLANLSPIVAGFVVVVAVSAAAVLMYRKRKRRKTESIANSELIN